MQSSNIPSKIPVPFANAAGGSYVNTIPVNSQIGITNGRASLADGFPPLTFTPIASGGVPPFGSDMNGILKEITAIQQWQEAGGFFPYDSAFSTIIGGYPKGAVLQASTQVGLWISTVENNTTNPDTGGAGWVPAYTSYGYNTIALSGATVTVSNLQATAGIIILTGTLTAACNVVMPGFALGWIIQNNTTGAYNVQIKTASGTGVNVAQGTATMVYGDGTNIYYADGAKVASFNGRTGAVTLTSADVTNALGFNPIPQFSGLGYNGTNWNNVTSSRSFNTTYTNTNGYPISVNVTIFNGYTGANHNWGAVVNGVSVWSTDGQAVGGSGYGDGLTFIVPIGGTYRVNQNSYTNTYISSWAELY